MDYTHLHSILSSLYSPMPDSLSIPGSSISLRNATFESADRNVLPGATGRDCRHHGISFADDGMDPGPMPDYPESLLASDSEVQENLSFRYSMFCTQPRAREVIFLFHGLNERSWSKYLPWGYTLAERTGKTVVLFPIAFHMNRASSDWGNGRMMSRVVDERLRHFPSVTNACFANAAISARIHHKPQRFVWSGLQTYRDVVRFMQVIRENKNPAIHPDAVVNVFAYSIGAFLAEILLMANPGELFAESRLFMFCGGPTLDRMYPSSRYILDSEAVLTLQAYLIEHLEREFQRDARLAHFFTQHASGRYFRAMLSFAKYRTERESRFRQLAPRIAALALRQDEVILPGEVMNTLQGEYRDIPVSVQVQDFEYPYTHIVPFPHETRLREQVNASFEKVFDGIANFLA